MSLSRSSVSSILKLPIRIGLVQREVEVVVQDGAMANDPVHEARLDERHNRGDPSPRASARPDRLMPIVTSVREQLHVLASRHGSHRRQECVI